MGRRPATWTSSDTSFEAIYGETADYEFASEMDEGAAPDAAEQHRVSNPVAPHGIGDVSDGPRRCPGSSRSA